MKNVIYEQLPPDDLEKELFIRKKRLENLIELKSKALKQAPEGKLRISHNKGVVQYYCFKTGETNGTYISKKDKAYIKALCQKDYDQKILKLLREQLESVKETINSIQSNNVQSILSTINEDRIDYIEPVTLSDRLFSSRWASVTYRGKVFEPETPEYYTANGERVRSKSEVMIADCLKHSGVLYRYEYPMNLETFTVYPDFYCLNLRTRKEFVWEHFGMMDSRDYAEKAIRKIKAYQKMGIVLGKNLIVTMESKENPISSKFITGVIEEYLV